MYNVEQVSCYRPDAIRHDQRVWDFTLLLSTISVVEVCAIVVVGKLRNKRVDNIVGKHFECSRRIFSSSRCYNMDKNVYDDPPVDSTDNNYGTFFDDATSETSLLNDG